jgi:hypothetical protein
MEHKIQIITVCLLLAYIVHWFRHTLLERRLDRMEKLLNGVTERNEHDDC